VSYISLHINEIRASISQYHRALFRFSLGADQWQIY
jgi:hypothetical protein